MRSTLPVLPLGVVAMNEINNEREWRRHLLTELRLVRESAQRVEDKLDGKVGRGELFGWLGAAAAIIGALTATRII